MTDTHEFVLVRCSLRGDEFLFIDETQHQVMAKVSGLNSFKHGALYEMEYINGFPAYMFNYEKDIQKAFKFIGG